jgi:hypothetical protein
MELKEFLRHKKYALGSHKTSEMQGGFAVIRVPESGTRNCPARMLPWPQRSVSGCFLILIANSTSRLIASARDGRSGWRRRQSSTMRKNCSDTRI